MSPFVAPFVLFNSFGVSGGRSSEKGKYFLFRAGAIPGYTDIGLVEPREQIYVLVL
jgi:hypothetical protein